MVESELKGVDFVVADEILCVLEVVKFNESAVGFNEVTSFVVEAFDVNVVKVPLGKMVAGVTVCVTFP